jgi:hypothetical protein
MRHLFSLLARELGLITASSGKESDRRDVVIRGERVLGGSGDPFFHPDVARSTGETLEVVLTPRASSPPSSP